MFVSLSYIHYFHKIDKNNVIYRLYWATAKLPFHIYIFLSNLAFWTIHFLPVAAIMLWKSSSP